MYALDRQIEPKRPTDVNPVTVVTLIDFVCPECKKKVKAWAYDGRVKGRTNKMVGVRLWHDNTNSSKRFWR